MLYSYRFSFLARSSDCFRLVFAHSADHKRKSADVDGWLQLALQCVNAVPPSGESWTSHSLRKGAASAAAAIGVVLDRICHFGGWSIHSGVVHDYIDPACPASDAAYAFFGWLLPPHMARSVSVG